MKKKEGPSIAAILAFVVLVPAFFLYYTLKDLGLAPGGVSYFRIAVIGAFTFVALPFLRPIISRGYLPKCDFVFLAFLSIFFLMTILADPLPMKTNIKPNYFAVGVTWFALYFMIKLLNDNSLTEVIAVGSFLIIATIVVAYSLEGLNFSLGSYQQIETLDANPSYQFFAFILISSLVVVVTSSGKYLGELAVISSLPLLLLIGSRTDLAVILLTFSITKLMSGSRLKSLVAFVFAGSLLWLVLNSALMLSGNRIAYFLSYGGGENWLLRESALANALQTISENPILGDPGSYERGLYAHSLISVWVDFGLLGFLLYLSVLLFFLNQAYRYRKAENSKGAKIGAFSLAFLLSLLPALIATKSADYYLVPIAFGLTQLVRYINRTRHQEA